MAPRDLPVLLDLLDDLALAEMMALGAPLALKVLLDLEEIGGRRVPKETGGPKVPKDLRRIFRRLKTTKYVDSQLRGNVTDWLIVYHRKPISSTCCKLSVGALRDERYVRCECDEKKIV